MRKIGNEFSFLSAQGWKRLLTRQTKAEKMRRQLSMKISIKFTDYQKIIRSKVSKLRQLFLRGTNLPSLEAIINGSCGRRWASQKKVNFAKYCVLHTYTSIYSKSMLHKDSSSVNFSLPKKLADAVRQLQEDKKTMHLKQLTTFENFQWTEECHISM